MFHQAPRLFDGCDFFFLGELIPPHPSKVDLMNLVKLSGGTILSRMPRSTINNQSICPYHAKPGSVFSVCHIIIVDSSISHLHKKSDNTVVVPPAWILHSLSNFHLLDTL